jgi:hypothetical protein
MYFLNNLPGHVTHYNTGIEQCETSFVIRDGITLRVTKWRQGGMDEPCFVGEYLSTFWVKKSAETEVFFNNEVTHFLRRTP